MCGADSRHVVASEIQFHHSLALAACLVASSFGGFHQLHMSGVFGTVVAFVRARSADRRGVETTAVTAGCLAGDFERRDELCTGRVGAVGLVDGLMLDSLVQELLDEGVVEEGAGDVEGDGFFAAARGEEGFVFQREGEELDDARLAVLVAAGCGNDVPCCFAIVAGGAVADFGGVLVLG